MKLARRFGRAPEVLRMKRIQAASLLALMAAVPAAPRFFLTSHPSTIQPCYVAGAAAYRFSDSAPADVTVRIDNNAARPDLRMQVVDDPAQADFMLVDDGNQDKACDGRQAIETIRLDNQAHKPDLTVALSRAPATHKIYVRSARLSEQNAAALFAVLWRDGQQAGHGTTFVARN
jgi:hypothetical protein